MVPLLKKTPEERKAIAQKAVATRAANRKARDDARQDQLKHAGGLRCKIAILEKELAELKRMETFCAASIGLTGKALLREKEIACAAIPWEKQSGVYFLLDGSEIVYVGQAVNVFARIGQHTDKRFDRYTFVPCQVDSLNVLESLYIHLLRPRLNGNDRSGAKVAPIALDALTGEDMAAIGL